MERFSRIGAGYFATCIVGGLAVIGGALLAPSDWAILRAILLVAGGAAVAIGVVGIAAEIFRHPPKPDPYDPSGGRAVVGKLRSLPLLSIESVEIAGQLETEIALRPLLRFENDDTTNIACVVQRLQISVWAHTRIAPTDMTVGSDEWNQWAGPAVQIIPEPTHAWVIEPNKSWNIWFPYLMGPYVADNSFDLEYDLEYRVGRPFAKVGAVEYRKLSFTVTTTPETAAATSTADEPRYASSDDMSVQAVYPPRFVQADISDESGEWWTYGPDRSWWQKFWYRLKWRVSQKLPWTDKGLG